MIFLKLTSVPGDSVVKGFEKQIVLESFQFGAALHPTAGAKAGAAIATKPDVTEVSVTLQNGMYSPALFRLALNGKATEATITIVKTNSDSLFDYLKYVLKGAIVTSWSQSSGGDRPSESLSLGYSLITMGERTLDAKGIPGTWQSVSWDERTRKVS